MHIFKFILEAHFSSNIDKGTPDMLDSSDNLCGIIQLQSNHIWGTLTGEFTRAFTMLVELITEIPVI